MRPQAPESSTLKSGNVSRSEVDQLMRAALATRERHNLTGCELAPALWRAQARPAVEHDDQLLLTEMMVIGVGSFPGRQLPQAQPEPLAARLARKACPRSTKPWLLARLIEDGIVDVRHSRRV